MAIIMSIILICAIIQVIAEMYIIRGQRTTNALFDLIPAVKRHELGDNDIIAVTMRGRVSIEEIDSVRQQLSKTFPRNKVVILVGDSALDIIEGE